MPLQLARQQQQKRQRELKGDQQNADPAPVRFHAWQIKRNLFGQIARPDDQQLRKSQISPDHHEGEQQLAHVVKMFWREDVVHRLASRQQRRRHNHEGEGRQRLAADHQQTEYRRVPFGHERHQPIGRGEGRGQRVNHEARPAQRLHPPLQSRIGVAVLFARPAIEQPGHYQPDGEIDHRAQKKERRAQPRVLVMLTHIRARPRIKFAHAERERQKQRQQQRHRARRRFEQPLDHHSPIAARQVLQHHNRQTAERDAPPEQIADQIRLEELFRADQPSGDAQHGGGNANDECLALEAAQFGRRRVSRDLGHCFFSSNLLRSAGGTSASVALRLNCSARM
ncbi:MAG: hypothetical protein JMDDDDMK_04465 [Acidobacteria bacterium]|nr:hypothetical protein [Acidobacteriota bacterium]